MAGHTEQELIDAFNAAAEKSGSLIRAERAPVGRSLMERSYAGCENMIDRWIREAEEKKARSQSEESSKD